jgi:hypothetical protein
MQQYQKMPPVSPPMMINVEQCMVREMLFVFQWWRQKKVWEPLLQWKTHTLKCVICKFTHITVLDFHLPVLQIQTSSHCHTVR